MAKHIEPFDMPFAQYVCNVWESNPRAKMQYCCNCRHFYILNNRTTKEMPSNKYADHIRCMEMSYHCCLLLDAAGSLVFVKNVMLQHQIIIVAWLPLLPGFLHCGCTECTQNSLPDAVDATSHRLLWWTARVSHRQSWNYG